jgi:hypothetical protein
MDPSIIIETEIPLKQIAYYVTLSCLLSIIILWGCQWAIIISTQTRNERQEQSSHNYHHHYLRSLINNIRLIASVTIFLHCSFLLCGINYRKLPMHTFLSSLYVATNAILPITLSVPSSRSVEALTGVIDASSLQQQQQRGDEQSRRVRVNYKTIGVYLFGPISSSSSDREKQSIHHSKQQQQQQHSTDQRIIQRMHQLSTLGTIIGMCICAIFRILDHGMQIQRYPMPIIIGATVGRVGGVLVGSILLVTLPSSSYDRQ